MLKRLSLSVIAVGSVLFVSAQSGKSFFKEGEKLREANQLDQAVEKYNLAVQVEPTLLKAYEMRANVYELLGKKTECANDRKKVAELDPGDAEHAALAAKAYLDAGDAAQCRTMCDAALKTDRKNMSAMQTKVRACIALNDLDCATATADAALALKGTVDTYYLHGLARMATRDYTTAETDLDRVIQWQPIYEPAYVAAAETQLALYQHFTGTTMQMRALEKAIDKCTHALELNPQSTDALFTRSKAYAYQKEYAKAIDDISHVISLGREDDAVYYQRALYYHGFGQHQNAVNDLNKLLLKNPKDVRSLLLRAECKEANVDLKGAKKDLDAAQKAMEGDAAFTAEDRKKLNDHKADVDHQIFEMNRESDPPVITVIEPFRTGEAVKVSGALKQVKVTGHVRDKNLLKSVTVDGSPADYAKDEKDPEFFISVPLAADAKEINVQAIDVYDNISTEVLKVERTESTPPALALTSPKETGSHVITIDEGKDDVFLEGNASDASGVRSITVDGIMASFAPDTTATDFSIRLVVKGKNSFTVRAEDENGNGTDLTYQVLRKAVAPVVVAAATNPVKPTADRTAADKPAPDKTVADKQAPPSSTGITWAVYIENTNYRNFPAPQGTASEADKMRKSFSKYAIQKTISKKNLSKAEMERFFNIELRDLVRTNKVSTILVWYAGHGRSAGGKAYWVPVDGKKDDIYSYYNYGPLKSLMENYSANVGNTLVVSDAAGSDASFYELTR